MNQKYLPIGTICTLNGQSKKIMIIGYNSIEYKNNFRTTDYLGCVYPEGLLLPQNICNFNHSDIVSVDFLGFENEDGKALQKTLNDLTGNIVKVEEPVKGNNYNDMFLTSNDEYSKLLFDENGVVMIADPKQNVQNEQPNNVTSNIEFDENGVVVSSKPVNVENPFNQTNINVDNNQNQTSTNIFKNIEFDENGVVVSADKETTYMDTLSNMDTSGLIKDIEFDENGVIISAGETNQQSETSNNNNVDEIQPLKNIEFDENGTVISE